MRLSRFYRLVLAFLVSGVFLLSQVRAQTITPEVSFTPTPSPLDVWERELAEFKVKHTPKYQAQKEGLLKTFKAQVISYQESYKRFALAKEQFEKLQTLKSLNEALEATRQVAILRDQVLKTYIELLHLELTQREPSLAKDKRIKAIQTAIELIKKLEAHSSQLENLISRKELYQALADYDELFQEVVNFSYQAKFILKTDKLFAFYKQLEYLKRAVAKQGQQMIGNDKLKLVEFQRGLDEVEKELGQIRSAFNKVEEETMAFNTSKTDDGWYKVAIRQLTTIHSGSMRAVNYLIELAGLR